MAGTTYQEINIPLNGLELQSTELRTGGRQVQEGPVQATLWGDTALNSLLGIRIEV